MKTTRLLLPFTHGIDMEALEFAVLLAKDREATLVPLALVSVPDTRRPMGARLEHIQQAKDFLEATQHKAAKHNVSLERFEVFTSDVVQSTEVLVQQLECDGILLFARGRDGMLLSTDEASRLREKITCLFYIVRLPVKRRVGVSQLLREYLPSWITGRQKQAEELISMQTPVEPACRDRIQRVRLRDNSTLGTFSQVGWNREADALNTVPTGVFRESLPEEKGAML